VTLISGPVSLQTPNGVTRLNVTTALDMHQASLSNLNDCDIFIACAAVADYRAEAVAEHKIKKQQDIDDLVIKLVRNPDIIAHVSNHQNRPFCVAFAAETQNIETHAKDKLKRKNVDLIAANDVAKMGQGFNSEKNALIVFSAKDRFDIRLADKKAVASQLLEIINQQYVLKNKEIT